MYHLTGPDALTPMSKNCTTVFAIVSALAFGTGHMLAAHTSATEREQERAFYENKPDQRGWPVCQGRQLEWRDQCVATPK